MDANGDAEAARVGIPYRALEPHGPQIAVRVEFPHGGDIAVREFVVSPRVLSFFPWHGRILVAVWSRASALIGLCSRKINAENADFSTIQ